MKYGKNPLFRLFVFRMRQLLYSSKAVIFSGLWKRSSFIHFFPQSIKLFGSASELLNLFNRPYFGVSFFELQRYVLIQEISQLKIGWYFKQRIDIACLISQLFLVVLGSLPLAIWLACCQRWRMTSLNCVYRFVFKGLCLEYTYFNYKLVTRNSDSRLA